MGTAPADQADSAVEPARNIESQADHATYLPAALEENDPGVFVAVPGDVDPAAIDIAPEASIDIAGTPSPIG